VIKTLEELRKIAVESSPPVQPSSLRKAELVDVTSLDSGIKLDVRYAKNNNVFGLPFYSMEKAFLQVIHLFHSLVPCQSLKENWS
jgi:D-alanyl-D-alanine dipeptidase